jgi:transketolase
MTGMAAHGGILPVGGTFFVFADYMRGAIRVAAISETKVIYVFTHDSIGVGEDGPTHQPVEHLASLRAMPGLTVLRPADAVECAVAWKLALGAEGPVALILSRQNLPVLAETTALAAAGVAKGAYTLAERGDGPAQVALVATGSEVALALEAADLLATQGVSSRVVSMPWQSAFDALDSDERNEVLPPETPVLSVEAGSTFGWAAYADKSIGLDHFGLSAPGPEAFAHLGFTAEKVAEAAKELVGSTPGPRRGR